jgi:4-hydroxy-tetrahydrodipicolinate synthase
MALQLVSRAATTFGTDGAFDEDAQRRYLQRYIDARLGVFMGSGGSGEGHALTMDELQRVYACGVAACKGKIPVWANPPEQYTARQTIEHSKLAAEAGCEVVNVYGLAGLHSMRPTEYELQCYFDDVLGALNFPVSLAAQPLVGYTIRPEMLAELCNRYQQVVAINLTGVNDIYFLRLKDALRRDVGLYVPIPGAAYTLGLGATGLLGTEANIIPKTYRRFMDAYESKDMAAMAQAYGEIQRFLSYVSKWNPGPTRWIKMCMKVLKLPGGEGGVREPYRMPPEEEMQSFTAGLLKTGIPEVMEMARAAGLVS